MPETAQNKFVSSSSKTYVRTPSRTENTPFAGGEVHPLGPMIRVPESKQEMAAPPSYGCLTCCFR